MNPPNIVPGMIPNYPSGSNLGIPPISTGGASLPGGMTPTTSGGQPSGMANIPAMMEKERLDLAYIWTLVLELTIPDKRETALLELRYLILLLQISCFTQTQQT
jgi:hypothetical protein